MRLSLDLRVRIWLAHRFARLFMAVYGLRERR
jgi:hypothetical protein